MKLNVVMHQYCPRGIFRIALATESLAKAKARKAQVRRGYIVTWRDGYVVSCEEPPQAAPLRRGVDTTWGPRELAIFGGDLGE